MLYVPMCLSYVICSYVLKLCFMFLSFSVRLSQSFLSLRPFVFPFLLSMSIVSIDIFNRYVPLFVIVPISIFSLVQTCVKCSRKTRFRFTAFYASEIQGNLSMRSKQPVWAGLFSSFCPSFFLSQCFASLWYT